MSTLNDKLRGLPPEQLMFELKDLLDTYDDLQNFSYNYVSNKGKDLISAKVELNNDTKYELNEEWSN